MDCCRTVKLQHISLASSRSISSRPMRIRSLLVPLLPLLPRLGLDLAAPIISKAQMTSSHLAVATLGRAAAATVAVVVLGAVVAGKQLAAVAEVVMVLAGATRAGAAMAGVHLGVRRRGAAVSSSSRGSRQVRLSLQAAGLQPTMDMCGTCLSGCQQPPWHSLLQPWGTNTCSMLVRPILPVLHQSCRCVLCLSSACNS